MNNNKLTMKGWLFTLVLIAPAILQAAPVTVDDLMRLSSISEVRLSPDGKQVAYVVSTPSFDTAAHEAVLFRIPATGGAPVRLTYGTRIFNKPLPSPWLRWSPDGSLLSFVAFVGAVPQVMVMAPSGGEPRAITAIDGGVTRYEWSPDGRQIAFVASDPVPPDDALRMKNKSYVEHVDHGERPPRLWLQSIAGGAARALTPAGQTVLDFHWAPDGRSLAYGASEQLGFQAPYSSGIYTISVEGGEPRSIVRRPGTNRMPQFSPDGRSIAFISTGGRPGMINAIDLYVVAADGRGVPPRGLTVARELWVNSFVWAPDGRALYYISDEQTNGTGEHMFEQGIFRVSLEGEHFQLLTPGRVVNYSLSLSADGRTMAYRSVESRTMGDVFLMDLANGRARRLTDTNPQLRELRLGDLEPVSWSSFDGKTIWGLLLHRRVTAVGSACRWSSTAMAARSAATPMESSRSSPTSRVRSTRTRSRPWPLPAWPFSSPRRGAARATASKAFAQSLIAGGRTITRTSWPVSTPWSHRASPIRTSRRHGRLIRRLHDQLDRHPDGALQGRIGGREPQRSGQSLLLLRGWRLRRRVLHLPLGELGLAARALANHARTQHHDASSHPAWGIRQPRTLSQAREFYKAMKTLHKTVEFDIYPRGGHVNYEPPLEREYMLRNLEWFVRWLSPSVVSDPRKAQR